MVDEEEQHDSSYTTSESESEETTRTDDSAYLGSCYSSFDKLFFKKKMSSEKKFTFLMTLFTLIASMTVVIIRFPLYFESMSAVSTAYTGVLFSTFMSTLFLGCVYYTVEKFNPPPPTLPDSLRDSLPCSKIFKLSMVYGISGVLFAFCLDQNRVQCHVQDPIKAMALLFSMAYYFVFSYKLMSLKRIFASTTVVVGLFISVNYGLCDEFHCRGREMPAYLTTVHGFWGGIRAMWMFAYVCAMASFAMFFTLLERHYITEQESICQLLSTDPNCILYTVSRVVSSRDKRRKRLVEGGCRLFHTTGPDLTIKPKDYIKPPIFINIFSIHSVTFLVIIPFCWVDMLPGIGRGVSSSELHRLVEYGLSCHFRSIGTCALVYSHGWICILAYVVFIISAAFILSMTESAVFTITAATVSLPLSGIWWGLYKMDVNPSGGFLVWSPEISGEVISSLLGLPIVLFGLVLLIKSHFKESETSLEIVHPSNVIYQSPRRR